MVSKWPRLQWIQTTEYVSQKISLSFYLGESCHLSECGWFFWHIVPSKVHKFSRLTNTIGVWFQCTTAVLFNICVRFLTFFLKNGIQPFARFTNYQIYNHWNCFVLWWRTKEVKYADSRLLLTNWRCLLNRGASCLADVWKHLKYWLSSNPSLSYWTYFPTFCWLILSKTR